MVRALWRLEPSLRWNPGRGGYGWRAVNIKAVPQGPSSSSCDQFKKALPANLIPSLLIEHEKIAPPAAQRAHWCFAKDAAMNS